MIIQITEPKDYSENALAVYRSLGDVYVDEKPRKDAHILVVRLKHNIDKAWLDQMPNIKVIASPTTGLNHIDMAEAEKRGIKIICLRGHTDFLDKITSTAEEAIGLMLALVRKFPWAFEHVKGGSWNRDLFKGNQLAGKTLGILGLGRLGKMVARYAKAMDMKVIASDPYVDAGTMTRNSVEKVSMEELFKKSDVVSIHVLLTDQTQNLVKAEHLKLMKPSAFFINTARAEILEKGALEKALQEKWIAGAAIDVMWDEKGDGSHLRDNPLLELAHKSNNLLIVPHIGGATYEAMQITEDFIADLVKKHFSR
jgi:D-3-phosphoglycerate dehydrogenase